MVRSKGETRSDNRELFHLVERIRADAKYFDVGWEQIERTLRAEGYFDCEADHECVDESGEVIGLRLRLNITSQHSIHETWKIAIKLHDTRIDGIDHEVSFPTKGKERGSGWHRHEWNKKTKQAERGKVELPHFAKGLKNRRMFLIKAFQELKVRINARDYDDDNELPFD